MLLSAMTAILAYWSHWGCSALMLILSFVLSFWWFFAIMSTVFACSVVACFISVPSFSIARFTTSTVKAVPLSVRMSFGTDTCLMEIESRPLTTDGASGRLKRSANTYLQKTPTTVS